MRAPALTEAGPVEEIRGDNHGEPRSKVQTRRELSHELDQNQGLEHDVATENTHRDSPDRRIVGG